MTFGVYEHCTTWLERQSWNLHSPFSFINLVLSLALVMDTVSWEHQHLNGKVEFGVGLHIHTLFGPFLYFSYCIPLIGLRCIITHSFWGRRNLLYVR